MKTLNLPSTELFHYELTRKYESPASEWKQEDSSLAEYELFIVTKGTFFLNNNHENYTLKQGEYLLLPPSKSHKKTLRYADSVFYHLHFSTNSDTSIMKQTDNKGINDKGCFTIPQTGSIPKPEKIVVLMKQLQYAAKNKSSSLALDSMTTSVIAELCDQLQTSISTDKDLPIHKQIHADIVDYIENNISKNLRISDIAAHFGYNEKYLSHMFAELTGITLKKFILSRKIESANFMLADSNKTIADIARELGFSDSHNFSRTYKHFSGLTPSEYRNAFAGHILFHEGISFD